MINEENSAAFFIQGKRNSPFQPAIMAPPNFS